MKAERIRKSCLRSTPRAPFRTETELWLCAASKNGHVRRGCSWGMTHFRKLRRVRGRGRLGLGQRLPGDGGAVKRRTDAPGARRTSPRAPPHGRPPFRETGHDGRDSQTELGTCSLASQRQRQAAECLSGRAGDDVGHYLVLCDRQRTRELRALSVYEDALDCSSKNFSRLFVRPHWKSIRLEVAEPRSAWWWPSTRHS